MLNNCKACNVPLQNQGQVRIVHLTIVCLSGFQVFEQEQGKGDLVMLQMLLFFQM